MKSFALALGSGGARGLAHIAVIEALDEMGLKPVAVAGTSIGALVGAAYAAGMSGKDIRHHVFRFAHDRRETMARLVQSRAGKFSDLLSGAFSQATQMDAEKFCAQFLPDAIPDDFAGLTLPLIAIATDLHRREEAAFSCGPLRTALAASIAFPGLFRPVLIGGRILVDGGATNPLPFDRLFGRADIVVAVNVLGTPEERSDMPGTWENVFTTINIMGSTIVSAKHQHAAPNLVIQPNVSIFRTLDFYQASSIIRSAEMTKSEMKEKLGALLNAAL